MASGPHDGADARQGRHGARASASSGAASRRCGTSGSGTSWNTWPRTALISFMGSGCSMPVAAAGVMRTTRRSIGAEVWAIDLGPAVEVARRNTERCDAVHVVQADLYKPPFAPRASILSTRSGSSTTCPTPRRVPQLAALSEAGGRDPGLPLLAARGSAAQAGPAGGGIGGPPADHASALPDGPRALVPRGMAGVRPLRLALPGAQAGPGIGQDRRADSHETVRTLSRSASASTTSSTASPPPSRTATRRAEVEAWLVRAGLEDVVVHPELRLGGDGSETGLRSHRVDRTLE